MVTDDQLKYPQWQEALREAILEPNAEERINKMGKIAQEIRGRLQTTGAGTVDAEERQALSDALRVIQIMAQPRPTERQDISGD